jgi:hypothetical protein
MLSIVTVGRDTGGRSSAGTLLCGVLPVTVGGTGRRGRGSWRWRRGGDVRLDGLRPGGTTGRACSMTGASADHARRGAAGAGFGRGGDHFRATAAAGTAGGGRLSGRSA